MEGLIENDRENITEADLNWLGDYLVANSTNQSQNDVSENEDTNTTTEADLNWLGDYLVHANRNQSNGVYENECTNTTTEADLCWLGNYLFSHSTQQQPQQQYDDIDFTNNEPIDFTSDGPTVFDFGDENDTASAANRVDDTANGTEKKRYKPSLIIITNRNNRVNMERLHQQWYDECKSKVSEYERVRGTRWTSSREQIMFIDSIVKPLKRSGAIFAKRLQNDKLQLCDARTATCQLISGFTSHRKQCKRQNDKRYRAGKEAERLAVLATLSDEPQLVKKTSIAEAERIINDNQHIFNERLDSGLRSFYIFYTSADAHRESTGFLSSRNSYRNDPDTNDRIIITKGNPVLRWKETSKYYKQRQLEGAPDPGIITGDQFRNILGARMKVLYTSKLQYNARMVEDSLQYRYLRRLELGQRLFRDIDRGNKFERPKEDKLHQVGVIYSDRVQEFINSDDIVVMQDRRKEDVDAGDWDRY